jgi:thioredoxin 1
LRQKGKSILIILLGVILMGTCFSWFARAQDKDAKTPPKAQSLPLLVALGRNQCMPCRMMAPVLDELKREYAGILNIEFVDVREHPEAMKKYGIRGIPFQILYDSSGKELKRHYGYMSKEEISKILQSAGIGLDKKTPAQTR